MRLYNFRILDLRFYRKRQPQHDEAPRDIQPVDDPTVEPPPSSEKHCKRAVLNIVIQLGLSSLFLREMVVGDNEIGSSVRVENRGAGTAEKIASLRFLA